LFQAFDRVARRLTTRDSEARRRLGGIALAILAELLLALLLLTLAPTPRGTPEGDDRPLATFDLAPDAPAPAPEPTPQPPAPAQARPTAAPLPDAPQPVPAPRPATPAVDAPPPAYIYLPPQQMAAADVARRSPPAAAPAAPRRGVAGPPDIRSGPRDTPRVEGTGPNGEPLYAAAWYREPYPEELRGYLSTARGPGWALIACRTVKDWRVEDCVPIAEYPQGSQMLRAVLAAAWQFKVRPPMLGGQYRVGEWVRIRIDYLEAARPRP